MTNIDPSLPDFQYDLEDLNTRTFDFGRVLGRAFSGLFANMIPLVIAAVIAVMATVLINIKASEALLKILGDGSEADIALARYEPGYWLWMIAAFLPAFLLALWFQLVVVQTSYAKFTKSSLQSSPLITGLRCLPPMFFIAVIFSFICGIGFIFAWPGWALAGPILVYEKKGIFGSIGEAWKLSNGHKLWVFLLLIVMTLIGGGIYYVLTLISPTLINVDVLGGDPVTALNISTKQQVLNGLVFGISGFFVYGVFAAGLTAAYVEIKSLKGSAALVDDVFS